MQKKKKKKNKLKIKRRVSGKDCRKMLKSENMRAVHTHFIVLTRRHVE